MVVLMWVQCNLLMINLCIAEPSFSLGASYILKQER